MKIEPRAYQKSIYDSILEQGNMLVVLPTGLGKTLIGFMLMENKIKDGKCLFLAPTKPLIKQHYASFLEISSTDPAFATIVTGEIPKHKREHLYEKQFIFSTPQTIKNDLLSNTLKKPNSFSLCVFDEAHRAVGNYAYTLIAEKLKEKALIVGLTASPGGSKERITKILSNLFIENVQIRTKHDLGVREHVKDIDTRWIETTLTPDLKEIKNELDKLIGQYAQKLSAMGFPPPIRSKRLFIALRQKILNIPSNAKYTILIVYSILFNLLHMQELVETQGASTLRKYLEKIETKTTKSAAILLKKPEITKIKQILSTTNEEHPKLGLLLNLMERLNNKKIIVFAQYRDQVGLIEKTLQDSGIPARMFLGKKGTYTRKQQEETIAQFREDKFRVLVASSIGEEGLDIPAVDVVIFYEPIPSEIRTIQRRGRAGRFKEGQIYILITKGTRDEYFHWAAVNREKKMKHIVAGMQQANAKNTSQLRGKPKSGFGIKTDGKGQSKLDNFF